MRTLLFPGLLALLITACGGGASDLPPTDDPAKLAAPEMGARIRAMEDTLFAKTVFDRRGAQALLDVYKAFAKAYSTDSMAPEYLFRAAGMSKGLGQPQDAVQLYDRIIKDYPSWKRNVDVLYMKALTLDDDLDRLGEARLAYQQVINNFPDHPFARDAKVMMQNLGLTDEELIAKFKAMQDSTTAAQ